MDDRSRFQIRMDAIQRYFMVNALSRILPLYIVTEYPKSGGSWLSQMLGEYLGVPFPRNRRPEIRPSIMHGHMLYMPTMKNVVCIFRDGRDVMVSLYYHMLFENEKNSHELVRRVRSDLGYEDIHDIRRNLPSFMEYVHHRESNSRSPFKFTWSRFVRSWLNRDVCKIRYEEMSRDCVAALRPVLKRLDERLVDEERLKEVVWKYSFENQARRKPGEEQVTSFIRKGQPGDWQEKFTRKAGDVFEKYYGDEMRALGYTNDDSWLARLDG